MKGWKRNGFPAVGRIFDTKLRGREGFNMHVISTYALIILQ